MNIFKKINFFILFFIFNYFVASRTEKADLIVFSYDRPLQLYATLESVKKYISNLGTISIIYRASDKEFLNAYKKVEQHFHTFSFYQQKKREDFKLSVIALAFFNSVNDYILFAADDIIVKDYVDIAECIYYLKQTDSYGFYLRLGLNINQCYMLNMETGTPDYTCITDTVYTTIFKNGKGDWAFPNNLDMTLYKKDAIKTEILGTDFSDPNSFECLWNNQTSFTKKGLFFKESKIINIPLNLVNESCIKNRNMDHLSPHILLKIFNDGLKIDIAQFYKINNCAPHMEVNFVFIPRTEASK